MPNFAKLNGKYGNWVDKHPEVHPIDTVFRAQRIIEVLVSFGEQVDAENNGRTVLVAATQQNHPDCVKTLIEAGANIGTISYGNTDLMFAEELEHWECADTLIAAVADLAHQNSKG